MTKKNSLGGKKNPLHCRQTFGTDFEKYSMKQILSEIEKKASRRKREYTKHKKNAEQVAKTYLQTNLIDKEKIAWEMSHCGKFIKIAVDSRDKSTHIIDAIFCKKRLCPLCQFRRTEKMFYNVKRIVSEPEFKKLQFVFGTLTTKNVPADKVELELNRQTSAWNHMTSNQNTKFCKSFIGWVRVIEITYNSKTKTYHIHIHFIAVVTQEYFTKDSKLYRTKDELSAMWKQALNSATYKEKNKEIIHGGHRGQKIAIHSFGKKKKFPPIDYLPIVDLEATFGRKEKSVAEISKYTVKPVDYTGKPEVLETLTKALNRKRCVAFGGLMKKVFQRLNLEDAENEILDDNLTFRDSILNDPNFTIFLMEWNAGARSYELRELPAKSDEVSIDYSGLVG